MGCLGEDKNTLLELTNKTYTDSINVCRKTSSCVFMLYDDFGDELSGIIYILLVTLSSSVPLLHGIALTTTSKASLMPPLDRASRIRPS